MGRWIDISMPLTDGLRSNHSRPGEEFRITSDITPAQDPDGRKTVRRINTRLHAGTHVDGPEHLIKGGKRLDEFPIETFVGRAHVADMMHKVPRGMITAADLEEAAGGVREGDILIVRTGWNSRYTEPNFFSDSPGFHPDAADWTIRKKLKMVAIDFLCDPMDKERQIGGVDAFKRKVLGAGVLVMTNADRLEQITRREVTFYGFPLRVLPSEAALTRAVVWEE
ncbi:MAG TPA: cyclase family protein [bacterium]|nr:cyclase family protein [bacterium]